MVQVPKDGDLSKRGDGEIRTLVYFKLFDGIDLVCWDLQCAVDDTVLSFVDLVQSFVAVDVLASFSQATSLQLHGNDRCFELTCLLDLFNGEGMNSFIEVGVLRLIVLALHYPLIIIRVVKNHLSTL